MAREAKKTPRYSRSSGGDVKNEMHRYKKGKAQSGHGGKVKSRKQAIAIGLSKARKKGKNDPEEEIVKHLSKDIVGVVENGNRSATQRLSRPPDETMAFESSAPHRPSVGTLRGVAS